MKNSIQTLTRSSALLLLATLSICTDVSAAEDKNQNQNKVSSMTPETNEKLNKRKLLAEQNQKIIDEAKESLLATQQALLDLEKNDAPSALAILQDVTKKLDKLKLDNPTLVLVVAGVEIDVIDFKGNAKVVEQKVKQASELLKHGKLQAGRMVVDELASEIDITTINIPLDTYPLAIKKTIELVNANKLKDAAQVLEDTLNTLVERTEIIPLPLLQADAFLFKASELENQTDLSKENNRDAVLKLVDSAKEKLKVSQLLGYGDKEDYLPLYKAIEDIKNTLHTEKSATTWAKVKQAFSDFKTKIMPAK
ncbi:YfdX family protein [Methylomonas sp. AM2-LC]|uniref:YfdX family protein n=1 Tax=Methylomonas sp. AM2-LC TaxID=3153301 RepID=UPI0032640D37